MCTGYSLVPWMAMWNSSFHPLTHLRRHTNHNLNQTRVGDWKTSWLHCSLKSGEKCFPPNWIIVILWAHLSGRVEWKVSTTLSCSCYPALSPDLSRGDKESPLTMAQILLASLHFLRLLIEICNWNVIVSKLSRFVCVLTWEVALGYEATQGGRMLRRRYYSNHWKCASSVCSPD